MPFSTHLSDESTAVLVISGEIDLADADQLRACGFGALAAPTCARLLLDLSQVTFVDSSILGVLVAFRNQALTAGQQIILSDPPPRFQSLLTMVGLDRAFTVEEGSH